MDLSDINSVLVAVQSVTNPWGGIILAVHFAAVAIVNLTPTPKDNEILAKVYRGVEWVAGIATSLAKK